MLAHRVRSWTSSRFFLRLLQRTHFSSCSLGLCFLRCISELVEAIVQESLSFISSNLQSELVVRLILWSLAYSKLSEQSCFFVLVFLMFVICICFSYLTSLTFRRIFISKTLELHRYQIERIQASKLVGRICFSSIIFSEDKRWFFSFVFSCVFWIDCIECNQSIVLQNRTIQYSFLYNFCLCFISLTSADSSFSLVVFSSLIEWKINQWIQQFRISSIVLQVIGQRLIWLDSLWSRIIKRVRE